MKAISILVQRYLLLNKKRTVAVIAGIILALTVSTIVMSFSNAIFNELEEKITERNGSQHATIHGLSEEQYLVLEKSAKTAAVSISRKCSHEGNYDNRICADVKFRKLSRTVYKDTAFLCEAVGMQKLSDEMSLVLPDESLMPYDVTFNEELLDLHGLGYSDGIGIKGAVLGLEVLVVILASLIMYSSFALSAFEKAGYLGTLGAVGATRLQKAGVIYGEAVFEGVIGIPLGILCGCAVCRGLQQVLESEYSLSMKIMPSNTNLVLLAILGIILVGISCSLPAMRASGMTDIELSRDKVKISDKMKTMTDLIRASNRGQVIRRLSMKTIYTSRHKYIVYVVLLVSVICLLVDGVAYTRGARGDYYPKDDRDRLGLDIWAELYTDSESDIDEVFRHVSVNKAITECRLERILEPGGILLSDDQIKGDADNVKVNDFMGFSELKQKIRSADDGRIYEGALLHSQFIGIDDETFSRYAKECGFNADTNAEYPVIIDDYVSLKSGNNEERREIIDVQEGQELDILYSRYGDMDSAESVMDTAEGRIINVDQIMAGSLYCIGCTDKCPDIPYFSEIHENIEGYQERNLGNIRIYMPLSNFEMFIKDPAYKDMYGTHPDNTVAFNYVEYKSIRTILFCSAEDGQKAFSLKDNISGITDADTDRSIVGEIDRVAASAGLHKVQSRDSDRNTGTFPLMDNGFYSCSKTIWQRDVYFTSDEVLKIILGFGVILIIAVFVLMSIINNISTSVRLRGRELAVLQSSGMTAGQIRTMLTSENAAFGIIAWLIGIPFSLLLLIAVKSDFEWYSLDFKIPCDMLAVATIMVALVALIPAIHVNSLVNKLNIIESIRNRNV